VPIERRSHLMSGRAPALAVEVRQCPLRSGAGRWEEEEADEEEEEEQGWSKHL
jgi:hypothetical protein